MRLIDADALKEALRNRIGENIDECINNVPTVDVLDKIRAEIERLHYHPKLDFIKNDEVVEMALDIIDKEQTE